MVRVNIYCMQKDEDDILEDWIIYHAYLFGISHIYIIDNYSKQPCLSILQKYQNFGLHWYQLPDYSKKGDYLLNLIKNTTNDCDIAIPLDVDEFIAMVDLNNMSYDFSHHLSQLCLSFDKNYYINKYPQVLTEAHNDKAIFEHFVKKGFHLHWSPCEPHKLKTINENEHNTFINENQNLILKNYPASTISCDKSQIKNYFDKLPKYGRYSFYYYLTSRNSEIDCDDPISTIKTFDLIDYEFYNGKINLNKKFFDPQTIQFLDHGNHHGRVAGLNQNQYLNTHLVLLHYHHRGVRKLIEKCKQDIQGLGIVQDINNVQELKDKIAKQVTGAHNIQTYMTYLTTGPGALCVFDDEGIIISTLAEKIKEIVNDKID